MGDFEAELYRRLKPLECQLVSKGFLRKSWLFKPSPHLEKVRKLISDFKISSRLANKLNSDVKVMSLVRSVKPDRLSVSLLSLPVEYQPFTRYEEAVVKGMAEFYKSPESITWVITFESMFNRWIGVEKRGHEVMRLLRRICNIVRKETELTRRSLEEVLLT